MSERHNWLAQELRRRGVSRREFLGFCTAMAGTLMLPDEAIAQVARAMQTVEKPILVWLEFQDCAGNTRGSCVPAGPRPRR
jgi:hydrogenase small subunit